MDTRTIGFNNVESKERSSDISDGGHSDGSEELSVSSRPVKPSESKSKVRVASKLRKTTTRLAQDSLKRGMLKSVSKSNLVAKPLRK